MLYVHCMYVCVCISCLPLVYSSSQLWIGFSCGRVFDKINANEEAQSPISSNTCMGRLQPSKYSTSVLRAPSMHEGNVSIIFTYTITWNHHLLLLEYDYFNFIPLSVTTFHKYPIQYCTQHLTTDDVSCTTIIILNLMWLVGSYSSTCVVVHCNSGCFGHVGLHQLINISLCYQT